MYCTGLQRKQKRLLPTAVPSVFNWSIPDTPVAASRKRRHEQRQLMKERIRDKDIEIAVPQSSDDIVACEVEINSSPLPATDCAPVQSDQLISITSTETQTELELRAAFLSFDSFERDEQLLHYYTGLESVQKLKTVFHTLGPAVNHLQYYRTNTVNHQTISPINQFILMLAKLRQDLDYFPLSKLCGISVSCAHNVFVTWINFCSRQWGEMNLWPEKDLIHYYLPEDFRSKFPTTRVIVDGTEIPIQKPSNPTAQRATFSTYKNRNTVKVIVGSTPGGLISYLSPAYGGSASDRQIIERSNLMRMCDPQDSVMADKGFNVQDIFAANDITVNIPTFFRKKNRMSGSQVLRDRKISSKRVHIERIIGLMKTYKILTSPLPSSEIKLASHIINVCGMLCNFRNRIISDTA